jgi:hypothetical protein
MQTLIILGVYFTYLQTLFYPELSKNKIVFISAICRPIPIYIF